MPAKADDHILKNVSGFPEFTPEAQILFNQVIEKIRNAYEGCGAVPIETSAVERISHILSKGGNDKEIYGLHRLQGDSDSAAKDYALHFDLTLPLARYVAQNGHRLVFPFKRYQIQPVWRGERAQNKRYRQFYQCDIDVIGDGQLSLLYDAEIPGIIYQIFSSLEIGDFVIRINNRKVLKGILNHFGIRGDDAELEAINIIDDLEKTGIEDVTKRLNEMGAAAEALQGITRFFSTEGSVHEVLTQLEQLDYGTAFTEGVTELKTVCDAISAFGVPESAFKIDLKIARGLDYYTGTVYETQLISNPSIGSICSGGRYENLAENFSKKRYPGVGISIGLSRLLGELIEKQILNVGAQSIAPVLVTVQDQSYMQRYLEITAKLRAAGIKTEIYLEPKKLKKQLAHADKKGMKIALIAGETEFANGEVQVKDLQQQTQQNIKEEALASHIQSLLAI